MYHNCSSPCELSIRNLNVIARLNPNSSLREAYYFGGVVSPAFKSHPSIAAMIYLVFNVFNIAACVYINSPLPSSSDKTLVNQRAILGPSLCLCSYPCLFQSSLPSSTQMPEWASPNTEQPEPCPAQKPWLAPHHQQATWPVHLTSSHTSTIYRQKQHQRKRWDQCQARNCPRKPGLPVASKGLGMFRMWTTNLTTSLRIQNKRTKTLMSW